MQIEISKEYLDAIIAVLSKQIFEWKENGNVQSAGKLVPIYDYLLKQKGSK